LLTWVVTWGTHHLAERLQRVPQLALILRKKNNDRFA
jgi:hypothetical protein